MVDGHVSDAAFNSKMKRFAFTLERKVVCIQNVLNITDYCLKRNGEGPQSVLLTIIFLILLWAPRTPKYPTMRE